MKWKWESEIRNLPLHFIFYLQIYLISSTMDELKELLALYIDSGYDKKEAMAMARKDQALKAEERRFKAEAEAEERRFKAEAEAEERRLKAEAEVRQYNLDLEKEKTKQQQQQGK